MIISGFNLPMVLIAIIGGSTMYAVAFDKKEVADAESAYIQEFKYLDKNNNKRITWSEMALDHSIRSITFINADKDGNKVLNSEEYVVMRSLMAKQYDDQAI